MRYLRIGVHIILWALCFFVAYLAALNIKAEGYSLKSCFLISGPFLLYLLHEKTSALLASKRKSRII